MKKEKQNKTVASGGLLMILCYLLVFFDGGFIHLLVWGSVIVKYEYTCYISILHDNSALNYGECSNVLCCSEVIHVLVIHGPALQRIILSDSYSKMLPYYLYISSVTFP